MEEAFPFIMAAAQVTTTAPQTATAAAPPPPSSASAGITPRRPGQLRQIPAVVYNTPRTRGRFYIDEIYDRDAADEEWYWVRWFGYAEKDDTAQHRDRLVEDGFGDLCDFVHSFKDWPAEAPDEVRTVRQFKRIQRVSSCLLFLSEIFSYHLFCCTDSQDLHS